LGEGEIKIDLLSAFAFLPLQSFLVPRLGCQWHC